MYNMEGIGLTVSEEMSFQNVDGQTPDACILGVFQKYAKRFHRMFAVEVRLMIIHAIHAWYMLIKSK